MNTILEEIKNQDYKSIKNGIEHFLLDEVKSRQANGFVLGLSGGIDSAVVAALCSDTLKEKTLALILPDSKITPPQETEDGIELAKQLGLDYKIIDINPIHLEFAKYLEPNDRALGNLRARIRANILYYHANIINSLVLGSSDKSEFLIGYFTKHGDGSSDLQPIVSLYKIQIREFAKYLNIPNKIIQKKSSPHLWSHHIAENELGVSYEEIDVVLYCMIDKKMSKSEILKMNLVSEQIFDKIYSLYKNSEHKRIMSKAFS
ncbi:MAG TPA: NAD+ synthase [Nitrosopumilaceae archaeon]|nr:NAD+ synthase [Nitrosopumilaceae archaeon]